MSDELTTVKRKKNSLWKKIVGEIIRFILNSLFGLIPIAISMSAKYFYPVDATENSIQIQFDLEFLTLAFAVIATVFLANVTLNKRVYLKNTKIFMIISEVLVMLVVVVGYTINKCYNVSYDWFIPFALWISTMAIGVIDIIVCGYKKEKRKLA